MSEVQGTSPITNGSDEMRTFFENQTFLILKRASERFFVNVLIFFGSNPEQNT